MWDRSEHRCLRGKMTLDGCSSPHVAVKLTDLVSAAWVSGSPSAFTLGKRQKKKGHTILGTAAQHLLKKSCRASAALQTKRAWRGFQSKMSSWGSDLVPVAAPVGSLQEVHFAGLTSMSSKRDHLTSISAELFVSWDYPLCYGYFCKDCMKGTAKCVFVERRPLL